MKWLWILVLWPFLAAAAAPENSCSTIRAAYARVALAAEHKFIDGMLSIQPAGFRAFGPRGEMLDLTHQRTRYQELLASAVVVRLTTEIEDYRERLPRATCQVRQCLRWEQVDARTNKLVVRTMESLVIDHWLRGKSGWRLEASEVRSQTVETQEADVHNSQVKPPRGQR